MYERGHITVMKDEVVNFLKVEAKKVYYDATLGGGGHSRAILEKGGTVVATDLDDNAIKISKSLVDEFGGRFFPIKGNFKDAADILKKCGFGRVDGVVADLGFSSYQINDESRGFSFMRSGPLDMRYDQMHGKPAYEILREIDALDLARKLESYADIRRSESVAKYLKVYFSNGMPNDTVSFADYLRRCKFIPKSRRIDPVTRVFMAIRMIVNSELENLLAFLESLPLIVKNDSVVVVISFHSAEDRIVKNTFRRFAQQKYIEAGECVLKARLINKKVVVPTLNEIRQNPRSRSAKLRAIGFYILKKED